MIPTVENYEWLYHREKENDVQINGSKTAELDAYGNGASGVRQEKGNIPQGADRQIALGIEAHTR
jgi:hypothetical protein